MSVLRFYRENHETIEATFGNGTHEGKVTFEKVEDNGARFAARIGEEEIALAKEVGEALSRYYRGNR